MVNRKNLVELRKTKNKNGLNKGLGLLGKGSIAACLSAAALLNAFGEIPANAFNTYHLMDNFGKSQLLVKSEGDSRPAVTARIDDSTESVLVIETDREMNLEDRSGSLTSIIKSVWGCDDEGVDELLRKVLGVTGGSGSPELVRLERENEKLKGLNQSLCRQMCKLDQKNLKYKKLLDKYQKGLEQQYGFVGQLSDENKHLKSKLEKRKNLQSTSYDANEQVKKLSEQMACLEQQLSNEKLENKKLNDIIITKNSEEQNQRDRHEDIQKKRDLKPIKTSSKMTAGGGNGDEVKELKKQVLDLKQQLEKGEQEKRNLAHELEINKLSVEKKISKMKNHLNQLNLQLKSQNNELLEELKHQKAHQTSGDCQNCNELKNENNELKERLNHLKFKISKSSIEQYKYQAKQFEQENVKLKNLVQETNEENSCLRGQLEGSQSRLSKLSNSSRMNSEKKNEKQSGFVEGKESPDEIVSRCQILEGKNELLKQKLSSANEDIEEMGKWIYCASKRWKNVKRSLKKSCGFWKKNAEWWEQKLAHERKKIEELRRASSTEKKKSVRHKKETIKSDESSPSLTLGDDYPSKHLR